MPREVKEAQARERAARETFLPWAWLMEHWPAVQADLLQTFGVRDDQAGDYQWPYYRNLVLQLAGTPGARTQALWEAHKQRGT